MMAELRQYRRWRDEGTMVDTWPDRVVKLRRNRQGRASEWWCRYWWRSGAAGMPLRLFNLKTERFIGSRMYRC